VHSYKVRIYVPAPLFINRCVCTVPCPSSM
jgi:hypothetical protein